MSKINKKYNDILEAAQKLFWKFGFKKVTIEEICVEGNVSKMTFYKHFDNKTELAKKVLDSVVAKAIDDFTDLKNKAGSSVELIEGMLKMKKDGINEISKEFLSDFYTDTDLGLSEYLHAKTGQVMVSMLADFKELQDRGLIRSDLNIQFYLYMANKLSTFMDDPYLLSLYANPEDLIMEFTNLFAYGMSPHNNTK
ncbi:MAG TPA: TetR/AcrR family transcriptional regulator [Prolixibacteraceae bacterium]|nr:TetR/AcrR family transcriptional regulator [Prolixibacteraceae bacterium]HPR59639.1 TetR/AcrR family transcriptional regulator [Prolixibacteraceae bacterium]